MKNFALQPISLVFSLLVLSSMTASAADSTDTEVEPRQLVASLVSDFVLNEVNRETESDAAPHRSTKVKVFPIDTRVSIPTCSTGYQFEFATDRKSQSYQTIKVTCPNSAWYLFVNAQVDQYQQVVVTADMVSPDSLLTQQNLTTADIKVQSLRNSTYVTVDELLGARIKHRVRPGQPITPNMICYVCKGDLITLSAVSDGLHISTKGIAQQDGNIGDTIRVRNSRSDKVVLARVADVETAIVRI